MQRLVWHTESIPVRSQLLTKRSLFPLFPKGSKLTYATSSLPVEKRSAKCYIHSHRLYLFIFQQRVAYWMCIPGNRWNPFIRFSASFSDTSTPQEPAPANPSPRCSKVKCLQIQLLDQGRPRRHDGQSSTSPACHLLTHNKPSAPTMTPAKSLPSSAGPMPSTFYWFPQAQDGSRLGQQTYGWHAFVIWDSPWKYTGSREKFQASGSPTGDSSPSLISCNPRDGVPFKGYATKTVTAQGPPCTQHIKASQ